MEKRIIISCLLATVLLFACVAQASALTGRLGNSRMVLRLEDGESAQRSLSVENINDVPLTIEILASGDLADNVEIEENAFELQPGEEKIVHFTITADGRGMTETKINVRFTPPQGGGVGLSANIIVISDGDDTNDESETDAEETEGTVVEDSENDGGFTFSPSGNSAETSDGTGGSSISPIMWLVISTIILIVIFIILIVYSRKMREKKRSRRPRE